MSQLCFCQPPCGQRPCATRVTPISDPTEISCADCDAKYIGYFTDAADAGWEWVTDRQMACPDCMDERWSTYDPETDSSATSFEAPEWSKETPK